MAKIIEALAITDAQKLLHQVNVCAFFRTGFICHSKLCSLRGTVFAHNIGHITL